MELGLVTEYNYLLCKTPMMPDRSCCNVMREDCQQYYYSRAHVETVKRRKECGDLLSTALSEEKLLDVQTTSR